ncbi:MAG: TldD/PmbA family protein [Dehalococcoidia bacterium]
MREDYHTLAEHVVRRALDKGADDAEVIIRAGREFTVNVRQGAIEKLIEATSQTLGLRLYRGGRAAASYTSDLGIEALESFIDRALDLTNISDPDEYRHLPEFNERPALPDLDLYDPAIASLTADEQIDLATCCEKAVFAADARITNSDGAEFSSETGTVAFANSRGFAGSYPTSAASLQVEAIVEDADQKKQRGYWYTVERSLARLLSPDEVAGIAAERVLRKLNGRKVATRAVPVVWERTIARSLLRQLAGAVSGSALYRRASFLVGREGEQIASPLVTLVDDPTIPGLLGSRPFDAEGVAGRRNVVIERGIFRQFLFDTYTGNKTGHPTTGNAGGGVGSMPGVSTTNFILEPGPHSRDEIIASVQDGLYLTELMGFGVNITTGDVSQGAAGIWIEDGRLTYPVSEVNIAGNLSQMLLDIDMVGDDVEFVGTSAAPTIRMKQLMVSGL